MDPWQLEELEIIKEICRRIADGWLDSEDTT